MLVLGTTSKKIGKDLAMNEALFCKTIRKSCIANNLSGSGDNPLEDRMNLANLTKPSGLQYCNFLGERIKWFLTAYVEKNTEFFKEFSFCLAIYHDIVNNSQKRVVNLGI